MMRQDERSSEVEQSREYLGANLLHHTQTRASKSIIINYDKLKLQFYAPASLAIKLEYISFGP